MELGKLTGNGCFKHKEESVLFADASRDINLSQWTTVIEQKLCAACSASNATAGSVGFLIHRYGCAGQLNT